MIRPLLFRVDASPAIGTGHVMRCLALAEAWQRSGGHTLFIAHCPSDALLQRIRSSGAGWLPLERPENRPDALADLVRQGFCMLHQTRQAGVWVVLDGYHFDAECHQSVRDAGCRLLLVDDFAQAGRYQADLLVNQNPGAEQLEYSCSEGTTLLLGTRYALLRPEFLAWQSWRREHPPAAKTVLVTLGGADPANDMLRVLDAFDRLADLQLRVDVVAGTANPRIDAVRQRVASLPGAQLHVAPPDMAELMARADVCVSAAGTTCWELAFMQLPTLVTSIVEHQQAIARRVSETGMAEDLGPASSLALERLADAIRRLAADPDRRREMARCGRDLVDGRGADRVVAVMQALDRLLPTHEVVLRRVEPRDVTALWRLANEPSVRNSSLRSERFGLDEHVPWFEGRLADPKVRMWVLDFHGLILGHVRYQCLDDDTAEISYAVTPAFRRRGLGTRLLLQTRQQALRELRVRRLEAVVREENLGSAQAFRKIAFRYVESKLVHGLSCHIFQYGQ